MSNDLMSKCSIIVGNLIIRNFKFLLEINN